MSGAPVSPATTRSPSVGRAPHSVRTGGPRGLGSGASNPDVQQRGGDMDNQTDISELKAQLALMQRRLVDDTIGAVGGKV